MTTQDLRPKISSGLIFAMAFACAVAVANIYYNQPLLGIVEREFGAGGAAAMIPTATQIGYALGLFLLVPLGDLLERRRLIVLQFAGLAGVLAVAAAAPNVAVLIAASVLIGVFASVAQQIIPFAANLASPERRGAVVGAVMSGLLCGILLSRTLAGFVGGYAGWRMVFWLSVPLALATGGLMASVLPRSRADTKGGYGALLASMLVLWRGEAALRRATLTQAAQFGSFSVFWTILALRLQLPDLRLGAGVAGLFGIIGVVGVLAAPVAGRLADRRGPMLAIRAGAAIALTAWALFGFWQSVAGLAVGVVLLDFGVQASMVSNQYIVYALNPAARGRLNTVYMTGMFLGGSAGSAAAAIAWRMGGWAAVCWLGAACAAGALAVSLQSRERRGQ